MNILKICTTIAISTFILTTISFVNISKACDGTCNTCKTSDISSPVTVSGGDTYCIDATGQGTLTINSGITLDGNATLKIFGGSGDEVVMNSFFTYNNFNNRIEINGRFEVDHDFQYERVAIENYNHFIVNGRIQPNNNGTPSLKNFSNSTIEANTVSINEGDFINNGTFDVTNNIDLNSGGTMQNGGTIKSGDELTVASSANLDLTGGIIDVADFTLNGGTITSNGGGGDCGAILVQNTTTIFAGSQVNSGDVELTDGDGTIETNHCGDCGALSITGSNSCSQTLPVEWYYFAGENTQKGNTLRWATIKEVNNDYYVIERSEDGKNFYAIAREEGAGTSFNKNTYRFTDAEAQTGYYYRVKQVDYDGAASHTKVIYVASPGQPGHVKVFPNPAHDHLHISVDKNTRTVQWINTFGKIEREENLSGKQPGSYQYRFNIGDMPAGIYNLKIGFQDNSVINKKVIVK